MEGLLNFLADNYIWFAGVSVFFAFALIGLVYESKKKKKAESKTADAVAQPVTAEATQMAPAQPQNVVVDTPAPSEVVTSGAPSLEGLEANTEARSASCSFSSTLSSSGVSSVSSAGAGCTSAPQTGQGTPSFSSFAIRPACASRKRFL